MQTNEVTLGALERRIDMSVALSDIESDVGQRLKKLAQHRQDARIPCRQGAAEDR